MNPKIVDIAPILVVGKRERMSLSKDLTFQLWSSFMPRRKELKQTVNTSLISMTVYDETFQIEQFHMHSEFDKWACVEVAEVNDIPEGFESYTIAAGTYAVFVYKGSAQEAMPFYKKIYTEYLPQSAYELASGPHFAVMGDKYKGNDPTSEEDIYIPIRNKK